MSSVLDSKMNNLNYSSHMRALIIKDYFNQVTRLIKSIYSKLSICRSESQLENATIHRSGWHGHQKKNTSSLSWGRHKWRVCSILTCNLCPVDRGRKTWTPQYYTTFLHLSTTPDMSRLWNVFMLETSQCSTLPLPSFNTGFMIAMDADSFMLNVK